jgi:hypothetical protein
MLAEMFNCQCGKWPIKYLGTHVCARRTTVAEMELVSEKIKKNMGGWLGGTMSIGGRVIKIDACLSNSALYQMSMRLFHKTNIEKIKKQIRAFFWVGNTGQRKYHLVRWSLICKPKSKGGLGIKDLYKFNISLMCKHWWKLEKHEGAWKDFMGAKYLGDAGIYGIKHRAQDSAFWSDMLHIKEIYMCGRRMQIGDGKRTDF